MKLFGRPLFIACMVLASLVLSHAVYAETIREAGIVARVIDGDTVVLQDQRHVRLDGINALEIPHHPEDVSKCLPSTRHADEPRFKTTFGCDLTYAQQAKSLLQSLTLNKKIQLTINPDRREDRYGRVLAQLYVADAAGRTTMVAGALVSAGLAHVYPLSGQEIGTPQLLAFEEQARQARRGIWQMPEFQITPSEKATTRYGHYTLISGKVLEAAKRGTKIYLNFGADYKTDFTAVIDKRDWSRFAGLDLLSLAGRTVLLRGFLYEDYGPAMRLKNSGQIQLIP